MTTFFEYISQQPIRRLFAASAIVTAGTMLAKRQSNLVAMYFSLAAFSAM